MRAPSVKRCATISANAFFCAALHSAISDRSRRLLQGVKWVLSFIASIYRGFR